MMKLHAGGTKAFGERVPRRQVDDDAEVAHRDVLAVDEARRIGHLRRLDAMRDDLVPVEVEVDPVRGAAPLGAAQELAVEAARDVEVGHREREVEARIGRGGQVAWSVHWTTLRAVRSGPDSPSGRPFGLIGL